MRRPGGNSSGAAQLSQTMAARPADSRQAAVLSQMVLVDIIKYTAEVNHLGSSRSDTDPCAPACNRLSLSDEATFAEV